MLCARQHERLETSLAGMQIEKFSRIRGNLTIFSSCLAQLQRIVHLKSGRRRSFMCHKSAMRSYILDGVDGAGRSGLNFKSFFEENRNLLIENFKKSNFGDFELKSFF